MTRELEVYVITGAPLVDRHDKDYVRGEQGEYECHNNTLNS